LIDLESVLFVSQVSATVPPASALAMIYQVPADVPDGIVTDVVPELAAPAASSGTPRLPIRMSEASRMLFAEIKNSVVVSGVPSAPLFLVVSPTEMVCPAAADAGADKAETIKSGPI
jgi:hypothetical protein